MNRIKEFRQKHPNESFDSICLFIGYTERNDEEIIVDDNLIFKKERELQDNNILFNCDEFRHEDKCKAWLIIKYKQDKIENDKQVIERNIVAYDFEHNHSSNQYKIELLKAKTNLIILVNDQANLYNFSFDKAYNQLKAKCKNIAFFPQKHSIKSVIYRKINKGLPKNIEKIEEIPDDSIYLLTKDELKFLSIKKEKFIVFMSEYQMQILIENNNDIFSDGTFKIASPPFYQCFVLRVAFNNHHKIFTVAFCLLLDKEESTYKECIQSILEISNQYIESKKLVKQVNPQRVHCDLEKAIINAWQSVFPLVEIKVCKFHLWTLWENQIKKFNDEYKKDINVRIIVKCIKSLMFIPPEYVQPVFQLIRNDNKNDKLFDFFKYINDNYIEQENMPEIWNYFKIYDFHTNNACEIYNRNLNSYFKKTPTILQLAKVFSLEENLCKKDYLVIKEKGYTSKKVKQFPQLKIEIDKYLDRIKNLKGSKNYIKKETIKIWYEAVKNLPLE